MSREDYRAWTERQSAGRFERVNGVVVVVAPERANNNLRKFRVAQALDAAVRAGGLSCQMFTDGMTVEMETATMNLPPCCIATARCRVTP